LLENTSTARELLAQCLEGDWSRELADEVIAAAAADPGASREFFRTVIEPLGDFFEPLLCDVYVDLFCRAIEKADPELHAEALRERYDRVRRVRTCDVEPSDVFVLSRITLGADVVVTSTLMDAAMRRWPEANIWFVGPKKNWLLFAGNPRVDRLSLDYDRGGTLGQRIGVWRNLRSFFDKTNGIVIDPDSRLTQLGLLPVCPEERYFFFESRAYGADGDESLVALAKRWARETLGVGHARPFVAPRPVAGDFDVTVSFGVGENDEKRVGPRFERGLLEMLAGRKVMLDRGVGDLEGERVDHAAEGLPHVTTWSGDYAPFASMIAQSELYIGYDSAGQHVAAAAGVPLVSVFRGHVSERMFQRWRPEGRGRVEVVKVGSESEEEVLELVLAAINRIV
jgi:hypothetical protein